MGWGGVGGAKPVVGVGRQGEQEWDRGIFMPATIVF